MAVIITLTTDFGMKDPFVGVMKGVILSRHPQATIVDLTHGIEPQDVREAAFWISRSYSYFPAGTVHVAVVDPGVGTSRAILAVEAHGHIFLAPDNGLLGGVMRGARVFRVESPELEAKASATFHGRDLFAPIAAELASGRARLETIGAPFTPKVSSALEPASRHEGALHGTVISVDRFGNLITNVDRFDAPADVIVAGRTARLVRTYGDAAPGELIALSGSFGALEISIAGGDAAAVLGVRRGAQVIVKEEGT